MLTKTNELRARGADSLNELQKLGEEANWLWIDCMNPDDQDLKVISGLLNEAEILNAIRKRQIFSHHKKVNGYVLLSIPLILLEDTLETYPLYVFAKKKLLITVRSEHSFESINNTLDTFRDCLSKVCQYGDASSFIVSRLFHEMTAENSKSMVAFRELIDRMEEEALEKPGSKGVTHSVFKLKKVLSNLHRLLWGEKELMSNMKEGVIPQVELTEEAKMIVDDTIDDINRELEFMDSYYTSLDSILTLQDLSLIHRVERLLLVLAVITLLMGFLAIIFLEIVFK
jgi:Mg2+ and Co2+ transporter CorA